MAISNPRNERFYLRLIKEGKLKVTKDGRAFNLVTGREIATTKKTGYRKLSWQDPRTLKIVQIQLHRLVWCVFKGIPEDNSLVINHKDGCKQNCRLSNLELTDDLGNARHAVQTGLHRAPRAEDNGIAVFTNAQVRGLRRRFAQGLRTVEDITEKYQVHRSTVTGMLRGKTYKSIVTGYEKDCAMMLKNAPSNCYGNR
jgi:hypothetical protein